MTLGLEVAVEMTLAGAGYMVNTSVAVVAAAAAVGLMKMDPLRDIIGSWPELRKNMACYRQLLRHWLQWSEQWQ